MTEVAGEVADGFLVHPFHTLDFVRAVTLPALERGLARGRSLRERFEIVAQVMVAVGTRATRARRARRSGAQQIAFYGSTPAYRADSRAPRLGRSPARAERAVEARRLVGDDQAVSDEMIEAVAVCAPMKDVAAKIAERCDGKIDRVSLVAHWTKDPDVWDDVLRDLGSA